MYYITNLFYHKKDQLFLNPEEFIIGLYWQFAALSIFHKWFEQIKYLNSDGGNFQISRLNGNFSFIASLNIYTTMVLMYKNIKK